MGAGNAQRRPKRSDKNSCFEAESLIYKLRTNGYLRGSLLIVFE
jgi:hypothetical protein